MVGENNTNTLIKHYFEVPTFDNESSAMKGLHSIYHVLLEMILISPPLKGRSMVLRLPPSKASHFGHKVHWVNYSNAIANQNNTFLYMCILTHLQILRSFFKAHQT